MSFAQKSNEAFIITVTDRKISVVSPSTKKDIVTVVVKNDTFDKILSELKSGDKTLKRFTLQPSGQKGAVYTLTVNLKEAKTVEYVSIAPPFQEVPLHFAKESYEIP